MKVFLGGTCNGSKWRNSLIPLLDIAYFNPVVENWTPECQQEELFQRENCEFCLYVITPKMMGVYSIAEVVDDSNKRPGKTIFCLHHSQEDGLFEGHELKALIATEKLIKRNGATVCENLEEVAAFLNNKKEI
jgi:hypothetical protein